LSPEIIERAVTKFMDKKIAVVADTRKEEVCDSIHELRPWLERLVTIEGWYSSVEEIVLERLSGVDYLVVFSGDGFLLSLARHVGECEIPVIGINFGKLGFLSEWTISEFREQLPHILRGECPIAARMMLRCELHRNGKVLHSMLALNEAVVKCAATSRVLYTSILIDHEAIANYGGDGVIIATPVGSTAYSLSAGGPILSPNLLAFVITPICPHALTLRPLVISSYDSIEVALFPPYPGDIILAVDGQVHLPMEKEDRIWISKANKSFYVVQTGHRSFFRILQEKFRWGEVKLRLFNSIGDQSPASSSGGD
jgi:NAD+ kinase